MKTFISLLVSLFFAAAVTRAVVVDKIIAKVGKDVITLSDLEEAAAQSIQAVYDKYPADEWDNKIKEIKHDILMKMIDELVLVNAAPELEITVSDEEMKMHIDALIKDSGISSDEELERELAKEGMTLDELKTTIRNQILAQRVLQKEVFSKVDVSEPEIEKYYEEHKDVYFVPSQVRVALILVPEDATDPAGAEQLARKIHEQLQAGADFAEMVKKYSAGPAVDEGGDIGYITKGKGLPEFESVVFNLHPGDISAPFKTQHGWNIVKVLDLKPDHYTPLAEVKGEIEKSLKMLKARDLQNEWLEKQRGKTFIEQYSY